jgi:hypothetical protein
MRTSLLASVVLVPVLAHADPRAICLESTIRDGDKTLSSPTVLALDGKPTSIVIASDGLQLALGLTARTRRSRRARHRLRRKGSRRGRVDDALAVHPRGREGSRAGHALDAQPPARHHA